MYTIASWNVNSIRARLDSVLPWLKENQPDVLAIQETKAENVHFPAAVFEELGYHVIFHGQKSYNGVAMISKMPLIDPVMRWSDDNDMACRLLAATIVGAQSNIRVVNVYVPNGQDLTSDKYQYKLAWLEHFRCFIADELIHYPQTILLGDFNIAPTDADVHDPAVWQNCVLVSEPERSALNAILQLGFKDSFRLFEKPAGLFSWWDYRAMGFRRNRGLRIDLILLSDALAPRCTKSEIDKKPRGDEKPSDHAPVWVAFT